MSHAADRFIARHVPLTHMTKVPKRSRAACNLPMHGCPITETCCVTIGPTSRSFSHPRAPLSSMAAASSFAKAFPSRSGGFQKSATAYMSLGTYLGNLVSQDEKGHVWGPVKDLGEDATRIDRMRVYRANARWVSSRRVPAAFILPIWGRNSYALILPVSPSTFFSPPDPFSQTEKFSYGSVDGSNTNLPSSPSFVALANSTSNRQIFTCGRL